MYNVQHSSEKKLRYGYGCMIRCKLSVKKAVLEGACGKLRIFRHNLSYSVTICLTCFFSSTR